MIRPGPWRLAHIRMATLKYTAAQAVPGRLHSVCARHFSVPASHRLCRSRTVRSLYVLRSRNPCRRTCPRRCSKQAAQADQVMKRPCDSCHKERAALKRPKTSEQVCPCLHRENLAASLQTRLQPPSARSCARSVSILLLKRKCTRQYPRQRYFAQEKLLLSECLVGPKNTCAGGWNLAFAGTVVMEPRS